MQLAVLKNALLDIIQISLVDLVELAKKIVLNALSFLIALSVWMVLPLVMDNVSQKKNVIQIHKLIANIAKTVNAINVLMDTIWKMENVYLIAKQVVMKKK